MTSLVLTALSAALLGPSPFPSQDSGAVPPPPPEVHYAITLTVDPEGKTISGRARLEGAVSALQFRFSRGYAFKTLEPRLVGELSIASGGVAMEADQVDAFTWQLDPTGEHKGGGAIDLEWSIKIDHREHPEVIAATDGYEQPYLTDKHGMIFTAAVVPIPELEEEGSTNVSVEVTFEAPEEWNVIAPWPTADGEARRFRPTLDGLRDDVVLLGNWRVRKVQAGALAATFAFAPGEEWLEPLVEERLGRIVEAEIELFGGAPQPKYLFVFGPSGGVTGYGGSPATNSMTLFVSSALPKESLSSGVSHLVAHEFHHTWMRALCQPEGELRFVIEGFTDYYAYVVSWRLGYLSDEAFKSTLEEKLGEGTRAIEKYGRSLADAGGPEFFLGRAAYDACYSSGLTLALWTDLALRQGKTPRTLDAFMRAFYGAETWRDGTRPALAHWEAQLKQWLEGPLAKQQMNAIQSMDGFDLAKLFAAVGTPVTIETRSAGNSPRANFTGATLRVLDPAGPAALAGLRARDRLISVNGTPVTDEPGVRQAWSKPVDGNLVLVFERAGEERTIDIPVPTILDYTLPPTALISLAAFPKEGD